MSNKSVLKFLPQTIFKFSITRIYTRDPDSLDTSTNISKKWTNPLNRKERGGASSSGGNEPLPSKSPIWASLMVSSLAASRKEHDLLSLLSGAATQRRELGFRETSKWKGEREDRKVQQTQKLEEKEKWWKSQTLVWHAKATDGILILSCFQKEPKAYTITTH